MQWLMILVLLASCQSVDSPTVYELDGREVTMAEMPPKYQLELYDKELAHALERQKIITDAAIENYLAGEAKKVGKSLEDYKRERSQVKAPSEAELKEHYEKNRNKIPYPYDLIKDDLMSNYQEAKTAEMRDQLIQKLQKDHQFRSLVLKPWEPKFDLDLRGYEKLGAANPKVTLIEFADMQCPHCAKAAPVLEKVLPEFLQDVQFVFIDYPMLSETSQKLAVGGRCAAAQGKFWEYLHEIFAKRGYTFEETARVVAESLKLDLVKFDDCLKGPGAKQAVADVSRGILEGGRLGVTKTPTFFVNGRKANIGELTEESLRKFLQRELKAAH